MLFQKCIILVYIENSLYLILIILSNSVTYSVCPYIMFYILLMTSVDL